MAGHLMKEALVRLSGWALLAWGLQLLVRGFLFALTHGSTEGDNHGTFIGLNALHYALLGTPFALLGAVGLAGLGVIVGPRIHRWGRAGVALAVGGLTATFVSSVMQYWIADPVVHFNSALVIGGWLLSVVGLFVTVIGLILAGLDITRSRALSQGTNLVLAIGLLGLATIFIQQWVVMNSTDSLTWKLIYGSVPVPYALCWAALGLALIAATRQTRSLAK
jgi:hypothetical protein